MLRDELDEIIRSESKILFPEYLIESVNMIAKYLVDEYLKTRKYDGRAAGLAAGVVGAVSIIVLDLPRKDSEKDISYVDPAIIESREKLRNIVTSPENYKHLKLKRLASEFKVSNSTIGEQRKQIYELYKKLVEAERGNNFRVLLRALNQEN